MVSQKKRVRPEKLAIVSEIRQRLSTSEVVFLAENIGMDMENTVDLKKSLKKVGGRYQVVPNGLLKMAASEMDSAFTAKLTGSTAVIYGPDSVEISRAVYEFQKLKEKPAIRRVSLSGKVYPASVVKDLALLPDRKILLSIFLGTLCAPMSGLAGVLHQKLSSLVYVLQAVQEKREASAG